VPLDHRCRFDQHHRVQTARAQSVEQDPEQAIDREQPKPTRPLATKKFGVFSRHRTRARRAASFILPGVDESSLVAQVNRSDHSRPGGCIESLPEAASRARICASRCHGRIAPPSENSRLFRLKGSGARRRHMVSSQFELSGKLRWKRDLRNSTVFSASRESCFLARPALVAAEAEIASTHAGERINFSRARVRATYMM
jgi:hypothetical protein